MNKTHTTKKLIDAVTELQKKSVVDDDLAAALCQTIKESFTRSRELEAFMRGAKTVLEQKGFETAARAIFDHCTELIGATSGYVALLSDTGEENEVLFLEAGGLPCDVDPELPMPIRGLRAEAYHSNSAVYDNDFMNSEWIEFMPEGHVILKNVMFAPLVIDKKTVGIIGLANKPEDFTDEDARMAAGFGELAAISLQNNRYLDERNDADKQRESVIIDLQKALDQVKKLSGLLPICSSCKKIRDDEGYWSEIEDFIEGHSEAAFTHGICESCTKKLYPDLDISED